MITPVSGHFDHIYYSDCVSSQLGLIVLSDKQFVWVSFILQITQFGLINSVQKKDNHGLYRLL